MSTPFDQPSTLATTDGGEGGTGAYSYDGKPDRWKRYRLPHPETGKAGGFTRATTFAKSIADTYSLNQWALRMAGKGLALRPDLLMQVASTGLDESQKLNGLMEQAKDAAGSKVGANLGTALHAFSESIDRGEDVVIPPPYRPHMEAYADLLAEYKLKVLDIERVVINTEYDLQHDLTGKKITDGGVAGTLDRIVEFTEDVTVDLVGGGTYTFTKGTIAILDLKTGKDLSYGWMEIAVQLSIYARSKVRFDKDKKVWIPMPEPMDTNVALVVHLPATAPGDTVKATMYAVNIAKGHQIAKLCTDVRAARKEKGLATALAIVEKAPAAVESTEAPIKVEAERIATVTELRPPTLIERANNARTEADLSAIWFEAVRSRQDKKPLADAIKARKQALLADTGVSS